MDNTSLSLDDLSSHDRKNPIKVIRMYKCMVCNEKFYSRITLAEHKLTHTIKPFQCMYCEYRSSLKDIMKNHISIQHGVNLKRSEINSSRKYDAITQEYKCTICNGHFPTKKDVHDHHIIRKMCKPETCTYCDEPPTKTSDGIAANIKEEDTDDEFDDIEGNGPENVDGETGRMTIYQCTVCSQQFPNKSCVYKHNTTHYGLKTFGCQYCDYRCSLKGIMKNHLEIRHGVSVKLTDIVPDRKDRMYIRAYKCPTCGKIMSLKENLRRHLTIKSECRRFKCDFCDYKSAIKASLNRHMQAKHNYITNETDVTSDVNSDGTQEIKMEIGPNVVSGVGVKEELVEEFTEVETTYYIEEELIIEDDDATDSVPVQNETIVKVENITDEEFDYVDENIEGDTTDISGVGVKEELVEEFTEVETTYYIEEELIIEDEVDEIVKEENTEDEASVSFGMDGVVKQERINDDRMYATAGNVSESIDEYGKNMIYGIVKDENITSEEIDYVTENVPVNNDGNFAFTNCSQYARGVSGGFQGNTMYYVTEDCVVDEQVTEDTYIKEEIVTDDTTLELFHSKVLKDT